MIALSCCYDQKGDHTSERASTMDPIHVSANPFMPEICPFLALACYMMHHAEHRSQKLFAGTYQTARFGEVLTRIKIRPDVAAVLETYSLKPDDIGTHSLRKGAITYVCSGSMAGPSIASICLRCGWSLGGVQDRYIRYEHGGDQFCGRGVTGLGMCTVVGLTLGLGEGLGLGLGRDCRWD